MAGHTFFANPRARSRVVRWGLEDGVVGHEPVFFNFDDASAISIPPVCAPSDEPVLTIEPIAPADRNYPAAGAV